MSAADDQRLTLSDGVAEIVVLPSVGAGLERYDFVARGQREPLFRAAPQGTVNPFALANILLVPWSNRISGGGFRFGGAFHPLEANVSGEAYPIHGNGFSSQWRVKDRDRANATFSLSSGGPGPFYYEAEISYALVDGALTMTLTVVNRAPTSLPYGLGFHPWLPRTADVLLTAQAEDVWLEDQRHLPTERLPIAERPEWDFSTPRHLPEQWINNAFDRWRGRAQIVWPGRGLSLNVDAGPELGVYIVYSPKGDADFFCFEPVSHAVDAHNLPGVANELVILPPGGEAVASCRFSPQEV